MPTELLSLLSDGGTAGAGVGNLSQQQLLAHGLYLVSIILFMLGIMRLGKVKTAQSGNRYAAMAMLLAVVGQLVALGAISPHAIIAGLVIGGAIGAYFAIKVQMTEMPEMVALFNGSGGLASTMVAIALYGERHYKLSLPYDVAKQEVPSWTVSDMFGLIEGSTLFLTIIIGTITFTGSLVAYAKLSGGIFGKKVSGKPTLLPQRHLINILLGLGALLIAGAGLSYLGGATWGTITLLLVTGISLLLGVTLVIPIGGGDMPVVISLLNSYSGIAAAMAGFAIGEYVLIVAGSLVGASGLILTKIMCKAMNRSLTNVMFGGFGADDSGGGGGGGEYGVVKSADPEEAAMIFENAQSCIVVPGYGMAVAQAQHAVRELAELLEKRGCTVRYAIHPVAGRMPGHMNVLLAEANVPYEALVEMDQINNDFKNTDVALVIGANDVVNPAAKTDKSSPIYGMPVLNVEESGTVFVIKRSLGAGFAGIKNTLFEHERCQMIYGDAKKVVEGLTKALKEG